VLRAEFCDDASGWAIFSGVLAIDKKMGEKKPAVAGFFESLIARANY